jgi:hypothetical protein
MKKLNACISVCTRKDVFAWTLVSQSILRHVDAEQYIVVVPDRYFSIFEDKSPKKYRVYRESMVFKADVNYCRLALGGKSRLRASWYYQQLLKLSALEFFGKGSSLTSVIWDADTFIVQKLDFLGERKLVKGGCPIHRPYYDFINDLGLLVHEDVSLISQFTQANYFEICEFIDLLEADGEAWYDRILNFTSSDELYFSEYETLGRYLICNHGYSFEDVNWSRHIPGSNMGLPDVEHVLNTSGFKYIAIEYPDLVKKLSLLGKLKFYKFTYGLTGVLGLLWYKLTSKLT